MYCPKCGMQNIEGAKFCRACGADIIAVLEQLTGRLSPDRSAAHEDKPPVAAFADEASGSAKPAGNAQWNSMFDWMNKPSMRPPLGPMMEMQRIGEKLEHVLGKAAGKKEPKPNESKHTEPKVADGIEGIFRGIGFVCVAVAIALFMPGGRFWWFWILIPAFAFLGSGVAEILRARNAQPPPQRFAPSSDWPRTTGNSRAFSTPSATPDRESDPEAQGRSTSAIFAPPMSVTEGTTRHLDTHASGATTSERAKDK